jgi:hypothetical protein
MGNLEPFVNVHVVQKIEMQHKLDFSFINLLPNSTKLKKPQNVNMSMHHTFTRANKNLKTLLFFS